MRRDSRLHGLTSDHHHSLVLSLRIREAAARGELTQALMAEVRRRFDLELRPHFGVEEEELLPALAEAGRPDLRERTLAEHVRLRDLLVAAEAGRTGAIADFGALLEQHVRFEERELFPACEALLAPDVLGRVAWRAPKAGRRDRES